MSTPPPLLAIAHGSRDPRAASTTARLLDAVRRRAARRGLPGLEVAAAYAGHSLPSPAQVLSALHRRGARSIVVLPLLLTDAFHSKTDIPELVRAAGTALPGLRIRYGATLGPDPLLIEAMERRLARAGTPAGDPGTAVVVAAAGSADPAASAVIRRLTGAWQACRGWRATVPAFAAAASPSPAEAIAELRAGGAQRVAVASYLLAPGVLADRVRETSLAAGAVTVSAVLGDAPELADLVLRRYVTAAGGLPRAQRARTA